MSKAAAAHRRARQYRVILHVLNEEGDCSVDNICSSLRRTKGAAKLTPAQVEARLAELVEQGRVVKVPVSDDYWRVV